MHMTLLRSELDPLGHCLICASLTNEGRTIPEDTRDLGLPITTVPKACVVRYM
jgi:hypothetical protein